jgi:hypothetical protein
MLRKLCALSERQILEALLATSMSAAEVRLGLEKLLSKRQKMAADFGLSTEFPELARRRIERTLDFDPTRPGDLQAVTLALADGTTVVPAPGDLVLTGGHLVHRDRRPFTPVASTPRAQPSRSATAGSRRAERRAGM